MIVIVRDGEQHPDLAGLIAELSNAVQLLATEIEDRANTGAARSALVDVGARLDPTRYAPSENLRESLVVALIRPMVVDLLVAMGMDLDRARACCRRCSKPCGQPRAGPSRPPRYVSRGGVALPPPCSWMSSVPRDRPGAVSVNARVVE